MEITSPVFSQETTPSVFSDHKSPIRGEGYSLVHTPDLIKAFEESGLTAVWAKQRISRTEEKRQYARHVIRFRRTKALMMLGELYPEVVLINAHDGSSSVNLMAGMFRTVCENGLIVATANYGHETIRHSRKTAAVDAVEAAHRMIECAETSETIVRKMMQTELNREQCLQMAEIAHKVRFGSKETELSKAYDPSLFLVSRRRVDKVNSLWNVFNRIQENVMKGGNEVHLVNSTRRRKLVKLQEISGISQSMDMNKGLWGAAVEMLEKPDLWRAQEGLNRGTIEL
jgi:hypothetical protein